MTGEVAEFDEAAGLGWVQAAGGGRYRFHCTQIADGSRRTAVGAPVEFDVAPGRQGAWEAAGLRPAGEGGPEGPQRPAQVPPVSPPPGSPPPG